MKKLVLILILVFMIWLHAFADKELQLAHSSSGTVTPVVYAVIGGAIEDACSQVYDACNATWITQAVATDANVDLRLDLTRTDYYWVDFPKVITSAGTFPVSYYVMYGADANFTLDTRIYSERIVWDGAKTKAIFPYRFVTDANTAAAAVTNETYGLAATKAEMGANFVITNGKIDDVNSTLTTMAAQFADANDINTLAGKINDLWLGSGEGGFP